MQINLVKIDSSRFQSYAQKITVIHGFRYPQNGEPTSIEQLKYYNVIEAINGCHKLLFKCHLKRNINDAKSLKHVLHSLYKRKTQIDYDINNRLND